MQKLSSMELRRTELRAFRMQSEHSTTELQPLDNYSIHIFKMIESSTLNGFHYNGVAED